MADLRSNLRTHLLAKAAVTAIVAQRIYCGNLQRDTALPCLTIERIHDDRLESLDSDTGLGAAMLRVKAYANNDAAAESIVDTVLAVDDPPGSGGGVANYSGGSWGTSPIDDAILTDRPVGEDDPVDGSDIRRRWSGADLTVWHQT